MAEKYITEQESFWAGDFGDAYVERNNASLRISQRTALFAQILERTRGVSSVLEFGTNIGQNLLAMRNLIPDASFGAIEINNKAIESLEYIQNTKIFKGSILEFIPSDLGKYDLTMTAGVLIHFDPKRLDEVYQRLYECSLNYILVIEYYNPTPVEVNYRGHEKQLFKRDFAGEILDKFSDLELVDYGFKYHRDHNFPTDDSTWFLLKKKNA